MNLENYIESQRRLLEQKNLLNPEYLSLYSIIADIKLKEVLASLHKMMIDLFGMLNERLPAGESGAHFWAEPSRDLSFAIEMTNDLFVH